MTGVAELLSSLPASAPVQRVRNYHLTDREARPRPRDFLIALRRSGGALCLRWPGPPGDRLARYAGPDWECAEHNRFSGRKTVETVDADRVREWIRDSRPELVARESVRGAFEAGCTRGGLDGGAADAGERDATADAGKRDATADGTDAAIADAKDAAIADGGRPAEVARVRVERYADLIDDPDLDRMDAEALAAALPVARGEVVFRLPRVLAVESVLEPVPGSDCVFSAEPVPERETDCAHYVRQDRRGCWVPKGEATVYELADGATLDAESSDARGSPESA